MQIQTGSLCWKRQTQSASSAWSTDTPFETFPSITALFHYWISNALEFHLGWHITGKLRNRNMRAMHGNGPKGPKKGKATGKGRFPKGDVNSPEALEPSHEDLVQQVISVLPEAALMRQQPQLDPSEWSTRACDWQNLDSSGGLSICPKIHIPQVLQQVGWTKEPVGILTSECPDTLGLRGFPRQEVFCTYSIMADGAHRKNVQVRKWLIQLGYGQFVIQKMFGPTVQLYSTMKEMVLKVSPHHDWPIQKFPANIVIEELSKIVSEHTISDIQPRESLSASFLCHAQSVDGLLRASGQRGIFIKEKKGTAPEMELLWLGEDHDLQSALKVAEKAKTGYGLAQKGPSNALRFAVRFRKLEDLLQYAKDVGLEESAQLGRFKLSGVNVGIGVHGILAFLVEQRWTAVEMLYVGEHHAVFLAGGIGSYGPMNYCTFFREHYDNCNSQR